MKNYDYFTRELPDGEHLAGNEYKAKCPFHDDEHPSLQVNLQSGRWLCWSCGAHGDRKDFARLRDGGGEAYINEGLVSHAAQQLSRSPNVLKRLRERYGWSDESIERWRLGYDGDRVWIPVTDGTGRILNVRKFRVEDASRKAKCVSWDESFGASRLFPIDVLLVHSDTYVVLCEGEKDVITAHQFGLSGVTQTGGAETWRDQFTPFFERRRVVICYDRDEAGVRGGLKVANALYHVAAEIRVIELPLTEPKGADLTDYFLAGYGVDDFWRLVESTEVFIPSAQRRFLRDDKVYDATLEQAAHAQYHDKLVRFTAAVIGKDMQPFDIPKKVRCLCDLKAGKKCTFCPMLQAGGDMELEFDWRDPEVLDMIRANVDQLKRSIRKKGRIVECNRLTFQTLEAQNAEEVKLIPVVDWTIDAPYVVRVGLFLGIGIQTNQEYQMTALTTAEPRSQYAIHVIKEVKNSKGTLETFQLTQELRSQLEVFQP